ncbi:MAG TPA: hypothetical protein PKY30_25990 [Myxococcota bacterium]|nr:hypothetical protein [Myxococcota bacterium]HNH50510.1 hypothetical protein [Myxococcota bacterium]
MRLSSVPAPIALRLRSLLLLLRSPAEWSAQHYARKNRMDFVACKPELWR